MKGFVRLSRFTPGLSSAEDVGLQKGDRIVYTLLNGKRVEGELTTDYRQHSNGAFGWECRFDDTGEIGFADELRVIGWAGKP